MPRLCALPNLHVLIHRLLCSLVHSHSLNHLNYCNMCRLDYAMMLSATLLAPTRYETVSKHHAASNVTIITYIEEIVKYWGNSEIPRKIRKYLLKCQWVKGYVSRTWSLYISRFKTDFPVKCRDYAHFPTYTYLFIACCVPSFTLTHSIT